MSNKDEIRNLFRSIQTKTIPLQYGDDSENHPGIVRGTPTAQIVCAYCHLGDYCRGCEDSKKKHKVQNKYVLDHNHLCSCKEGCEKCLRGLVHDFCNKVAIQALDNLVKLGKLNSEGQLHESIVDYLNRGLP